MSDDIVIDASALLCLLLGEPGADRVEAKISTSFISSINFSEVVAHFARNGLNARGIREILEPMPMSIYPFDEDLAYRSGLLLPITRKAGLSLGDRACLALAQHLGVPAMTADRAWSKIAKESAVEIELLR